MNIDVVLLLLILGINVSQLDLFYLFLCTVILLAATVSGLALIGSSTSVVYICSSLYVETLRYGWGHQLCQRGCRRPIIAWTAARWRSSLVQSRRLLTVVLTYV